VSHIYRLSGFLYSPEIYCNYQGNIYLIVSISSLSGCIRQGKNQNQDLNQIANTQPGKTPPPQTICHGCLFSVFVNNSPTCINPDETGINCANVIFCNSFTPKEEVESPCVSFGEDEA
jgi:hypothetical protein